MWVDAAYAARHWADAATLPPATLTELLTVSEAACADFAPALLPDPVTGDPAPIPDRYRLAVVLHARDLRAAAQRDNSSALGPSLKPVDLCPAVRGLLRPPIVSGGIG